MEPVDYARRAAKPTTRWVWLALVAAWILLGWLLIHYWWLIVWAWEARRMLLS